MGDDERSPAEAARNEAVFRDANEQIEGRRKELALADATPYLCECEDPRCTRTVRIDPAAYERVRRNPRAFVVAPDHETTSGTIVERNDGYWVAVKEGEAGAVAAELHPRG